MTAHLNLLDLITLTILSERYKLLSSSLWTLLHSLFESLLDPNIHLRILFSNTLTLHSPLNVRDLASLTNSYFIKYCPYIWVTRYRYDHADVLAGAGTIALEIMEDLPDVDVIISPIGGGGLLAGTCAYAKGNPTKQPLVIVSSSLKN